MGVVRGVCGEVVGNVGRGQTGREVTGEGTVGEFVGTGVGYVGRRIHFGVLIEEILLVRTIIRKNFHKIIRFNFSLIDRSGCDL